MFIAVSLSPSAVESCPVGDRFVLSSQADRGVSFALVSSDGIVSWICIGCGNTPVPQASNSSVGNSSGTQTTVSCGATLQPGPGRPTDPKYGSCPN